MEFHGGSAIGVVYSTKTMVKKGEIGIPARKITDVVIKEGDEVKLRHAEKPES